MRDIEEKGRKNKERDREKKKAYPAPPFNSPACDFIFRLIPNSTLKSIRQGFYFQFYKSYTSRFKGRKKKQKGKLI